MSERFSPGRMPPRSSENSARPKGTPVTPGSTTLGDYLSGLYGCMGVLMALRYRDLTGRGQYIDVALYEFVFRCTEELAPAYAMYGTVRERHGPHVEIACPYGHFPTKDGKWVAIACTTDKLFENRHDVNEIVRDWCGSLPRDEVLRRCHEKGAPAGPLNNIADIFGNRQFHARRNMVAIDEDGVGETLIVPNIVPRLSETPGRIDRLGPRLGEHTDEVLKELGGLSDEDIRQLREKRVI